MRYDITNIPVAEVFEEGDGCPICRLRNTLECTYAQAYDSLRPTE